MNMTIIFNEVVSLANAHKKDEVVGEGEIIALIYKYWYAECSEQELFEDLSYLVEWEEINTIIEEIRELNPDFFVGELKEKYQKYFEEIQAEND